ncbi:MAG: hypothetical protein NVSMB26_02320 [Beijerinckiaceae bacterium]
MHGTLLKNGLATSSFTQADIDNGLVTYHETGPNVGSDSFTFTVTDAANNTSSTQTFHLQINKRQNNDFNGDGISDMLWRNTNGDVALWNSNAGSESFTAQDIGLVSSDWMIQRVGDFNNDGQADILWRNTNGDVALWNSNAGSESFTAQDFGLVSSDWMIQGVGDFNNDGKADILWRNTNGDVALWNSNAGSESFTAQDIGLVSSDWKLV